MQGSDGLRWIFKVQMIIVDIYLYSIAVSYKTVTLACLYVKKLFNINLWL